MKSPSVIDDELLSSGVGDVMVVRSQPITPKLARYPMPIGEKITLKFEVACGRPVLYEWLKQGVTEDITQEPVDMSVKATVMPVG